MTRRCSHPRMRVRIELARAPGQKPAAGAYRLVVASILEDNAANAPVKVVQWNY